MSDKTPRRWLAFSLQSLLVLVLVVAAYFAGWRSATWTAEREKEAAVRKAVEELQAAQDREVPRDLSVNYVPEVDVAVVTGPAENAQRVQRFLQMQQFLGRAPFGSKRAQSDTPSNVEDVPPPSRAPQEQP
jgi:hypothetical protein